MSSEYDRRDFFGLTTGVAAGLGASAIATVAGPPVAQAQTNIARSAAIGPDRGGDATARLQRAIDRGAALGQPVLLEPGFYTVRGTVRLATGTKLVGSNGLATIDLAGRGRLAADNAADLFIADLEISGASSTRTGDGAALIGFNGCNDIVLSNLRIHTAPADAVRLWQSSGRIEHCRFQNIADTAINSGDASGPVTIAQNSIRHTGNNGIVVWRETAGPDGTSITHNDIAHIRSDAGGSGQNGNAINVFRAGNVIVASNTIASAAYSAVRCNAASNTQVIANNCRDLGEVALYAEFAFEGTIIANNIVDKAATGIEVTNFKEGGRLASVQGNLVRNLFRREHEPVDKRGIGIGVEADSVVCGNTIENAPTAGMVIGWGPHIRQVVVSANLIRNAPIGIGISNAGQPGSALVTNNMIHGATSGAVRLLDHNEPVGQPLENGDAENLPAILQGNVMRAPRQSN